MGERLRGLRELKGLTVEQLAKELGVDPEQIRSWESGEIIYSDSLIKYANYFNVTTDYIVRGSNAPIPQTINGIELTESERSFVQFMHFLRNFNKQGKLDIINSLSKYVDESERADAEELIEKIKEILVNEADE